MEMKLSGKLPGLICVIAVLFLSGTAHSADMGIKYKLAVLPFITRSVEGLANTERLSSILQNYLENLGQFEIIEKKKVEGFIELEGLRSDQLTSEDIYRIGTRNGIDFLLSGSVSKAGMYLSLELRLLNANARKSCLSDTIRISEAELSSKLQETARDLVKGASQCSSVSVSSSEQKHVLPPAAFRASGTPTSIRLVWTHPEMSQLIGFKVFRSTTVDGTYSPIATVTNNSFSDDNLNLNETFYYKIQAIGNTGEESELSPYVVGRTSVAPKPPIFLGIKSDIKSAHLEWRPRPGSKARETGEAGYKVYRKAPQDKDFREAGVVQASVEAANVTYTDTGLSDKTLYAYCITAFNSEKAESEFSTTLDVVTQEGVGGLKAVGGKIRLVPLSWVSPGGETTEGYIVYRSENKDGQYARVGRIKDRMETSFTDKVLLDNKTYWYRVSAYNPSGTETDMSAPVSVTTRDVPPTPKGYTVKSREPRKSTHQWEVINSPDEEIRGYRIYRSGEEKGEYRQIGEVGAGKSLFVDDGTPLKNDTTYYYRITSFNSADAESLPSATVSAITKAAPKPVTMIKANSGEVKKVTVSWQKNQETDIREYTVYKKRAEDKDFDTKSVRGGDNAYVDSDLKDGTDYVYMVRAVDADGLVSEMSQPVSAKTKPLPEKPSGLRVSDVNGRKTLLWDANKEKDVRQYKVYKKGFLGATVVATVEGTAWTVEDVKDSQEFSITAVDETLLESERSEPVVIQIAIQKK